MSFASKEQTGMSKVETAMITLSTCIGTDRQDGKV